MAEISDLIKYMQSESMERRKAEKESIDKDKEQLELLKNVQFRIIIINKTFL